jgi:hypothetical protein
MKHNNLNVTVQMHCSNICLKFKNIDHTLKFQDYKGFQAIQTNLKITNFDAIQCVPM